jgi:hypothetical protein
MENSSGKQPGEVLSAVKQAIPSAIAVKTLKSGDIDVHVTSQKVKDQVLNGPTVQGIKILRRDYLLEIPGVDLTLQVNNGKNADNTELINTICAATKRIIPEITITRVRWLHNPEAQKKRNAARPMQTRGTLIIGVPTQAIQQRIVQQGLIINSQLFEARLFHNQCVVKQCFKCCSWGHTQNACGKQARCGQCAGAHDTAECSGDRVSCTNCGKEHRAWQRKECRTFQVYLEDIQATRMALLEQTTRVRKTGVTLAPQDSIGGFTLVTKKRPRAESPPSASGRTVGRPPFTATALQDPMQSQIRFGARSTQTPNSTNEEDMNIDSP